MATRKRGSNILVNGAIPLTEDTIQEFRKFVEWILDMDLTEVQETELRQKMIDEWKETDQQSEELVKVCLLTFRDIMKADAATQESWRKENQPTFISQLRKEMSHNQFAYALINDYDEANPPSEATASSSTDTGLLIVGGLALLGLLGAAVVSSAIKNRAQQAGASHSYASSTDHITNQQEEIDPVRWNMHQNILASQWSTGIALANGFRW